MQKRFVLLPFLAAALAIQSACSSSESATEPEAPLPHEHRFELSINGQTTHVQLALSEQESSRGLMEREHLDPDEGMLFVFTHPRRASFWMKNTPLPLDIGYFSSDGVLREVHRLFPFDETSVPSQKSDIHFALEMNQGWFSQNEVRPGARLDLDEIRNAIEQRGFEPSNFRL